MKRTISTDDAPAAVGAYSQATTNGDLLITAGQLPLTVDGELLDDEPVAEQTRQCLENVAAILESEGLSLDDVLETLPRLLGDRFVVEQFAVGGQR